ncbi:membrane protein [Bacteroidia bacterium]|nr:membrane protein [Bacteroidia bacterium]
MKKYISLTLSLIVSQWLTAQDTLTLQQCIVRAIEQSFEVKILQNEEQIARNNFTKGNAGYLPNINGNVGASGHLWQWKEATDATHNEEYLANVGVDWNVFDGHKKQAAYEWLREMQHKGELNTRLAIETLISEITTLYYDLVQRNINTDNMKESLKLSRHRLRIAKEKFLLGACSRLEVLQAEVDFNADSSAYAVYVEGTQQLKFKFKQRLQIPCLQDFVVADSVILLQSDLDMQVLHGKALLQNIRLQVYDKNRAIAEWERKQTESTRYPQIKLNGSYGYLGTPYDAPNRVGLTYGATLGIKIYDGANQRRLENNAKLQQKNRELEYQQEELQVLTDLHSLYSSYKNYLNLLQLETNNSQLAKEKAGLALEQYQLGQLSSLEMREFQRTMLEAQNRLTTALYQAKYAEINLMELCAMASTYLNVPDDAPKPIQLIIDN